ncbi:MAG TPA: DUF2194 domain-containing protein [Candidatus Limiplasma sp.]|nr:DUF2194 domain-containing protein [Candidatus Limiplasma sp.]
MMKKSTLLKLLLPALVMLIFIVLLLTETIGISMEERSASLEFLTSDPPQKTQEDLAPTYVLVAVDASNSVEVPFAKTLTDTLSELRMNCRIVDLSSETLPDLDGYTIFLYCSQSLTPIENDMDALFAWIEDGGHFALTMTPVDNDAFHILYRKLGIVEYSHEYFNYHSLEYVSELLPLWGDSVYHENNTLSDFALIVRLDDQCTVHMESGGDMAIPLLWERPVGQGRIAVFNTTLMFNKGGRGFAVSILYALEDTLVYPIINAAMVFVDDFPAPQPEGYDEELREEFGYDIQGFFRNHWWPDMKQLCWDFGVRYTGLLIETYNDNVTGPFTSQQLDDSLLKYYTAELLHSGGELGLHGYNHQPLCPEGFDFGGVDYTPWPSTEAMSEALVELARYGKTLFIDANYRTYVAPSNYLSDIGRQVLLETLPEIKAIAGLYLSEIGVNALVQEFNEGDDGAVNVPRISSGFVLDDYTEFVTAHELVLHGVYSHFIHPDDVLDSERTGDYTWSELYAAFRARLEEIVEAYPMLRFLSASEGAAAIQRYSRLVIERDMCGEGMKLILSNFYDEAWIAFRTLKVPTSITGGELYKIAEGFYWIRADEPEICVQWEAEP